MTLTPSQTTKLIEWFCSDDTGVSSQTIAAFMSGVNVEKLAHHSPPLDPSDLGRCLRLLELFPEWKTKLPEMATINKKWAKIIPHWNQAESLMKKEVGIHWEKGRTAPKTYEFMKQKGF